MTHACDELVWPPLAVGRQPRAQGRGAEPGHPLRALAAGKGAFLRCAKHLETTGSNIWIPM